MALKHVVLERNTLAIGKRVLHTVANCPSSMALERGTFDLVEVTPSELETLRLLHVVCQDCLRQEAFLRGETESL